MVKISSSPERNTFQRDAYIKQCEEEGKEPSPVEIKMYEMDREHRLHKFDNPKARINNLEFDLRTTEWILEKVRNSDIYAQNLYAALCNNEFQRTEIMPILKDEFWSCSWRYAGGIIADMKESGDYMDWYCSSYGGADDEVHEGHVTDEIRADLLRLGWVVKPF